MATKTKAGHKSASLERLVRRGRANAIHTGLALCVEWTNWCRNNGWPDEALTDLEGLFWEYRDADGKLKAPNAKVS